MPQNYGDFTNVFEIPEYREAMEAYRGLEGDITGRALQRMMQRQAGMGTLRAGGITDYPTLDIMRGEAQRLGQVGAGFALRHADVKGRRADAATAFERQKEMAQKQFEWQKQLIDHQIQRQKEAQPGFWEQALQTLGGAALGGFVSPLLGLAGTAGQKIFGGLQPKMRIPQIPGLTGQFGPQYGHDFIGPLQRGVERGVGTGGFRLDPMFQAFQDMSPWDRFQHQRGMGEIEPILQMMMLERQMNRPGIDWESLFRR